MVRLLVVLGLFSLSLHAETGSETYETALALFQQGKLADAEIHLKNSVKASPSYLPARLLLGKVLQEQGKFLDAEKELEKAKQLNADDLTVTIPLASVKLSLNKFREVIDLLDAAPSLSNHPQYYLLLGRSFKGLNLEKQAELSFNKGIEQSGNTPDVLTELAAIYITQSNRTKAFEFVNAALSIDSQFVPALLLKSELYRFDKQYQLALESINKALTKVPDNQAAIIAKVGLFIEQGELELALTDILSFRERFPENPYAKLLHSSIVAQQGHTREARLLLTDIQQQLSGLSDQNKKLKEVLLFSGVVDFINQKPQSARIQFTKFLNNFGENVAARRYLSIIEYRDGSLKKAIEHIEKALELSPNNTELYVLAAQYYEQNNQAEKQLAILQDANQRFLGHDGIRQRLIGAYASVGEYDKALQLLNDAELDKDKNQILLAYLHLENRDVKAAHSIVQALLDKKVYKVELMQLAAEVSIEQGETDEAIRFFNEALTLDSTFIPALTGLAGIYINKGEVARVAQYYQQVLDVDTNHPLVNRLYADLHIQNERYGDAIGLLSKLDLSDDPKTSRTLLELYIKTNQLDKASVMLRSINKQFGLDPNILLSRSRLEEKQGNLVDATKTLNILYGLVYDDAQRLTTVAHKQLDVNDREGLNKTLDRIKLLAKGDVDSYLIARIALSDNNGALALETANNALTDDPDSRMWLEMKVHSLLVLGQDQEAMTLLESLYKLGFKRPHLQLLVKLHSEKGNMNDVVTLLKEWLQKTPYDSWAVAQLSGVSASMGKLDVAISTLEAFPRLDETPVFLNNLAYYYININLDKALGFALKAYELAPHIAAVNDTLGWIYTKHNKPEQGLSYLREANARDSQNADILFHLAYTLAKLNSVELARQSLDSAIKLNPEHQLIDEINSLLAEHN